MFGANEFVLHPFGGRRGGFERFLKRSADAGLSGVAATGQSLQFARGARLEFIELCANFLQQWDHDPCGIIQQGREQVQAFDFRVSLGGGQGLGSNDRFLGFDGQFIHAEWHLEFSLERLLGSRKTRREDLEAKPRPKPVRRET